MSARQTPAAPGEGLLDRRLTLLLAVACGIAVANNYYAQPLLDAMATTFGVSQTAAGVVVTTGQVGYAIGLAAVVPLGDVLDRRRLVAGLAATCAVALAAAAAAPGLAWLAAALLIASLTSVLAQVLIPFAATLAGEADRGRVVGTVMTGLLFGILLARTVAGLIADLAGWRAVYAVACALLVILGLVLHRRLPALAPASRLPYPRLLASVFALVREEPRLRGRAAIGALTFAGFSAFWSTMAFLLSGPPYGYGEAVIGLFGLFGVAGALAARRAGRLHDRGHGSGAVGALLVAGIGAFGLIALGERSLAALIAGIVVMDLAVQGVQVLNQSTVYGLRADARSRLISAYMTSYFAGGALGSAAGIAAYDAGGWTASAGVGAVAFALGLALWAAERRAAGGAVPTPTS